MDDSIHQWNQRQSLPSYRHQFPIRQKLILSLQNHITWNSRGTAAVQRYIRNAVVVKITYCYISQRLIVCWKALSAIKIKLLMTFCLFYSRSNGYANQYNEVLFEIHITIWNRVEIPEPSKWLYSIIINCQKNSDIVRLTSHFTFFSLQIMLWWTYHTDMSYSSNWTTVIIMFVRMDVPLTGKEFI